MIKNERQYRITKAQAKQFKKAIAEMARSSKRKTQPVLHKAQIEAMRSQLGDLERDIEEYEMLRSGKRKLAALVSIEELPRTPIQARTAAG